MKKLPVCKYCGKVGHYEAFCYQKNKILYQRKKEKEKMGLLPSKTACNPSLSVKRYKVSSRKRMSKTEASRRRKLIKELDRLTSLYIRYSYADKSGYVNCYTCGKRLPYRYVDNGHWQSRRYQQTRWDLDNCRPQCRTCLTGDAELYRWDFSPIKQKDIKVGDMILARNPMSEGVMIVKVEGIEPFEVKKTKKMNIDGDKIEGTLNHLIETDSGFQRLDKVKKKHIIKIWKK